MKNLWPEIEIDDVINPVNFLKEQGKYLEEITKGVLTYYIDKKAYKQESSPSKEIILYNFYIQAPFLDDYRYLLFFAKHDLIHSYPIEIGAREHSKHYIAKSQEDFEKILEKVLGSDKTKSIVTNLYARGNQKEDEEEQKEA